MYPRSGFYSKIILLAITFTTVTGCAIAPCLPKLRAVFENTPNADFLVKSLLLVSGISSSISALFIGIITDKIGRKAVLIISTALYAFGGGAGFIFDSLYLILAGRIIAGIGIAGVRIGITTLSGDYFKDTELWKFMGTQNFFYEGGCVFFAIAGGFLVTISWKLPFLLYFLPLLILPWAFFGISEPLKRQEFKEEIKEPVSLPLGDIIKVFLLGVIGGFFICLVFIYIPFYIDLLENTKGSSIGVAIGCYSAFAATAALFYRKIKTSLSFTKLFLLSFLIQGIGFIIIGCVSTYYLVVLGLIIAGSGSGIYLPALKNLAVTLVSFGVRGRVVSILDISIATGTFSSLLIMQLFITYLALSTFILITGIGLISISLGALIWLLWGKYNEPPKLDRR